MARRIALAVIVAATATLATVGPAGACSLVVPRPSEEQLLDQADLVFVGTAVASEDSNTTTTVVSSADPITWTFRVEEVRKGAPSDPQRVRTARGSATCGFPFQVGRRYVVFASADGDVYTTGLGSGTRELTVTMTTSPPPVTTTPPPASTTVTTRPTSVLSSERRLADTGGRTSTVFVVALGLLGVDALLGRQVRRAR